MPHPPPQPSAADVRAALLRILGSEALRSAARQQQFLAFVVEEALEGRAELLKERTIARRALGQPATYDPRIDPLVRVLAGRVRASLDRYYAGPGADDPVRIEIPKGSYHPAFSAAGELPPSTAPAGAPGPSRPSARPTAGPTVAVTVFADRSPSEHPPFLSVGFTESLVASLARYQGIEVVGPLTTAEGEEDDVALLAERGRGVGADLVLSGSVRRAGSVTRLTANLVDVASLATRWSARFEDRTSDGGAFDAEDRIAEHVSALLADPLGVVHLTSPPDPRTTDAAVYRAMLAYYAYARSLDRDEEAGVLAGLEDALEREPDNPLVAAMVGSMLVFHGVGDAGGTPPSAAGIERGVELCRRSDALLPGNPLASLTLAFDRLLDGDPDGARARFIEVLDAASYSPSIRSLCGIGLALSGAWDDGLAHLRAAMALNPNHPKWQHGFLSLDALVRGDAAEALAEARRVETPGLVWGPLLRAAAHGAGGEVQRRDAELARLDPQALASAMDHDRFLSHSRLPDAVVEALGSALAGPGPTP